MNYSSLLFCFFLSFTCFSQDAYHQSILDNLSMNHNIQGGTFIFSDTEAGLASRGFQYGNASFRDNSEVNMDFTLSKRIVVTAAGNNAWDVGMGQETTSPISEGDLILVTFWAKENSSGSQVFVFAEDANSFDKQFYFSLNFTPDWNQYFVAFKATQSFATRRLKAGFHLATTAQDITIAGFTAINYKDAYGVEDLPTSFSPFNYEGIEEDAPWRALAESRIERLRKADLTVNVSDKNGNPVEGAMVSIEMQQHEFGFGSALVTCRFPGNNCFDQTYVQKIFNLDGEGHGFNECVNENALKWRGWEEEWLGTPEQTVSAFEYLNDSGVTMRGHNLLWPGSDFLPQDINDNLDNLDYLRQRIDARLSEMITQPRLSKVVRDWDVLNEITTNRTLEEAFRKDPNFDTGRELYGEIFRKVREMDPDLELYINDYMAISSGSAAQIARYKSFLDELKDDDVPFDGIGFQSHIGSVPNSIPQVEAIFDDFYQRYNKRMKVTEYDINAAVDEGIQAQYLRDFLTLTFSHPGMDAFIMWGFWDGNHWKANAPMFEEDWTLKPSGEMFIQKVFNDWWTEEENISGADGRASFRPFKGKHKIIVSKDGMTTEVEMLLGADEELNVVLGDVDSVQELDSTDFVVSPNPVTQGQVTLQFPNKYSTVDISIYDVSGKQVLSRTNVLSDEVQNLYLSAGTYNLEITTTDGSLSKRLLIL